MKRLVVAIWALILIGFIIGLAVFRFGIVPVNADVPPSALESRFIPAVLHASVAHRAEGFRSPTPATDDDLIAGREIYTEMCARCHGLPGKGPSVLGASFYPPAPQFAVQHPGYTDGELFWIVKHGIRNTGMPAWGRLLSDEDTWQVVAALRNIESR
jgi:mono/diheme cytochrome c family protein